MLNIRKQPLKPLSELEHRVMDCVWSRGPSTAESVRAALASSHPLKDSTVRTLLRRLEEKGYLTHRVEGRTYIYQGSAPRQNVAVRAVKQIIDRFCGGSVEQLLVGMVDNEILDRRELDKLARRISRERARQRR